MESKSASLCRLCFQSNENLLNVWETINDATVASILEKHFWFQVSENDGFSEWLCQICWTQTRAFHEFYEKVEAYQRTFWDYVKKEDISGNEEPLADISLRNVEAGVAIAKCEATELTIYPEISQGNSFSDYDDNSTDSCPSEHVDTLATLSKNGGGGSKNSASTSVPLTKQQDARIRDFFALKCDLCNDEATFESWPRVRQHFRQIHKIDGYLTCCDKKFQQRGEMIRHIRSHSVPKTGPDAISRLTKAEQDAQIREYFAMKCDQCNDNVEFETFAEVKQHYLQVHNMNGYLRCCGSRFRLRCQVIDHIRQHVNPDALRCDQCGKMFKSKATLQTHISNHVPMHAREFKCTQCTSSFSAASILRSHIKNIHSHTGERFPCSKCDKTFRSSVFLATHMRTIHERTSLHVCETCARQFKTKHGLRMHIEIEHSTVPQRKVQCTICNAWVKNTIRLSEHMRTHKEIDEAKAIGKIFKCSICDHVSKHQQALKCHVRTVHTENRFPCTVCGKAFKLAKTFKEHMAGHTGQFLYSCRYCDRKFKSGPNKFKHLKRMHADELARDNPQRAQSSALP